MLIRSIVSVLVAATIMVIPACQTAPEMPRSDASARLPADAGVDPCLHLFGPGHARGQDVLDTHGPVVVGPDQVVAWNLDVLDGASPRKFLVHALGPGKAHVSLVATHVSTGTTRTVTATTTDAPGVVKLEVPAADSLADEVPAVVVRVEAGTHSLAAVETSCNP